MANQAIIFGLVGAGGLLLTSAITDSSLADTIQGHANKVSHSPLGSGVVGGAGAAAGAIGRKLRRAAGTTYTGPAGVLNRNQQKFAATFAKATGLDLNVVTSWLLNEEPATSLQAPNGANNWLNVGSTDSGFLGGANPAWGDPVAAANYTARWLAQNQPSILSSVGQSPTAQAEAIQNSGWASSHYGYFKIVSTLQGLLGG